MKKRTLFACLVMALAFCQVFADELPSFVSQNGKVKWYYLRNVLVGKYMYSTGTDIYSKDKADLSDFENCARELWCFTATDSEGYYTVTNKFDGKQMDTGLSAKYSNYESLQMKDSALAKFKITVVGGDTIEFEADRHAPGGGEIYRWPSVWESASSNYLIWLVRDMYGHGDGAHFVLEPFEAEEPEAVNDETVPYYNIVSAKDGCENEMIYDNTSVVDTKYKFAVGANEDNGNAAQWCLVSNHAGKYSIVNRATGNSISTNLNTDGKYNLPDADAADAAATAWTINAINADLFVMSSNGFDGFVRYLNNTTLNEEPEEFVMDEILGSGFTWRFVKADEIVNGISNRANAEPTVSVVGGKVVVSNGKPFTITATDGVRIPSSSTLQRGIYIVTVEGKSVKINVR